MNKVVISGNLCKNVELKFTANNVAVMQNTLAVKNDFKNANGEYESQFINIVAFGKTAEYLNNYCKTKGSKILAEGRITTRQYDDKDAKRVYVTEIVIEKVEILNKKEENAPFENELNQVTDDQLPF